MSLFLDLLVGNNILSCHIPNFFQDTQPYDKDTFNTHLNKKKDFFCLHACFPSCFQITFCISNAINALSLFPLHLTRCEEVVLFPRSAEMQKVSHKEEKINSTVQCFCFPPTDDCSPKTYGCVQCVQKRSCLFSSGGPDVFLFVNIVDNAPVYLTSRCFQLLPEPFVFSIIIVQNILIIFTSHVCNA